MTSLVELEQELAQANRHIVEGRARLVRQFEIKRRLEAMGEDTTRAETLFRAIEDVLEVMLAHHQHIVRKLDKASAEEARLAKQRPQMPEPLSWGGLQG